MAKDNKKPSTKKPKAEPGKRLRDKAFGPAAENFGKVVAPLGLKAGELTTLLFGKLLDRVKAKAERVLNEELPKRLEKIPEEKRVPPDPRIALPAVRAMTEAVEDDEIREMFLSLLESAMHNDRKASIHPSFVELIKEMTKDDAVVLKFFKENGDNVRCDVRLRADQQFVILAFGYSIEVGLTHEQYELSLSNLARLGIVEFRDNLFPINPRVDEFRRRTTENAQKDFASQIKDPEFRARFGWRERHDAKLEIKNIGVCLTPIGDLFARACLRPKPEGLVKREDGAKFNPSKH